MKHQSKWLAVLFTVSLVVLGFFLGGFLGGRVFGGDGVGFDKLGDALGGMGLGMLTGLGLGIGFVGRLNNRERIIGSVAGFAATLIIFFILRAL